MIKSSALLLHGFFPTAKNHSRPHLLRHHFLSIYSFLLILSHLSFGFIGYTPVAVNPTSLTPKIISETNLERQKMNLQPVTENEALKVAAQLKLKDMFDNNYWDHVSPQGLKAWYFIDKAGYYYTLAGENLARGFTDSESMTEAWMKSPSHRENILNPQYQEIGVAIGNGMINGKLTTLAVQLFGNPSNSPQLTNNPLVAGKTAYYPQVSLKTPLTQGRAPMFIIYVALLTLLIVDGIMIRLKKQHLIKKHLLAFRLSLAFNALVLVFMTLTFSFVA